jgi:hypothetical protein
MGTPDIDKLNSEMETLLQKQRELQDKIASITSEFDEYKTKILTNRGLIENVSKKNATEVNEIRTDLNEVKSKSLNNILDYTEFKKQQKTDNTQVNTEINRINASVTSLTNNSTDLTAKTNTINTKLTTLENKVYSGNDSKLINLEKAITSVRNSFETHVVDSSDSFKNLSNKCKIDIDKLNTRVDNIKTDFTSFQSTQNNNIQSLTNKIDLVDDKFNSVYTKPVIDGLMDLCYKKTGGEINGIVTFKNENCYLQSEISSNADAWRIKGFKTSDSTSYLEIATADDGNEGIVVRQYSHNNLGGYGVNGFNAVFREAWLLDQNGNASFPKTITANKFSGKLEVGGRVSDLSDTISVQAPAQDKNENTFYINNIYGANNLPTSNIFNGVGYSNLMTIRGQFISQLLLGSNGVETGNGKTHKNCSIYYRHMRDVYSKYSDWSRIAFSHEPIVGEQAIFREDNINFNNALYNGAYNISKVILNGTNNTPSGLYDWGIMTVAHSIDQRRNIKDVVQIYYPHGDQNIKSRHRVAFRVGHSDNVNLDYRFAEWQYLVTQGVLDEALEDVAAGLKRNKQYSVGMVVGYKHLPSWAKLECVQSGTTASTVNFSTQGIKQGDYIVDGTTKWIVDDVRDGTRIGSVTGSLYLPDGYVLANGATVNRANFPRLVNLANKYNLWTNNPSTDLGLFGRGDGNLTFVLPNWMNRMMQFTQGNIGRAIEAGLPNITGEVDYIASQIEKVVNKTGAFKGTHESTGTVWSGSMTVKTTAINIDASRSNAIYGKSETVQPPAIRVLPIIRY